MVFSCLYISQAQKDALPENDPERAVIDGQLERVRAGEWMCEYFDKVFDLSAKLTDWSMNSGVKLAPGRNLAGVTRYAKHEDSSGEKDGEGPQQSFLICTGGGPGFMEAANMGSASISDARSIGVSICPIFCHMCYEIVCATLEFYT